MTYSVIIPHSNSLDTLSRAINSIPNVEYIEVIVIDNSLTPINKSNIVGVERDFRLIYSSPTRGAGGARNEGIEASIGDYLVFLDADDFFSEDSLTYFEYIKKLENKPDIAFFNVKALDSVTLQPVERASYYNKLIAAYVKNPNEVNRNRLLFRFCTPWCKFYKADIIRKYKIRFDEVPASNDVMFTEYASSHAKTIIVIDGVLYHVTARENSLTRTPSSINLRSRFEVQMRQTVFLRSLGMEKYANVPFSILGQLWKSGMYDFFWGIKMLFKYKVNPVSLICQKYRYKTYNVD